MDLEDLIGDLGIGSSRPLGPRGQRVARLVVGLLLAALALAGAWHVSGAEAGAAFRLASVGMFLALALFGLFGIALGIGVRFFGCLFVGAFAGMIAARLLFGA